MRIVFAISFGLGVVLVAFVATGRRPYSTVGTKPRITATANSYRQFTSDGPIASDPSQACFASIDTAARRITQTFEGTWAGKSADYQARYQRGEIDADGLAIGSIEHDIALESALREGLGAAAYRIWDKRTILENFNVGSVALSSAESDAVYDLERDLQATLRQAELQKLRGTTTQKAQTASETAAQSSFDSTLRSLLGDERASMYIGKDNDLAHMSQSLSGMPLRQDQLVALADAQQQWDASRSQLVALQVNTEDSSIANALRSNDAQWEATFIAVAGAAAFERYQRAQDTRYGALRENAQSWGIASAEVDRTFDSINDFEETLHTYRDDARSREVAPATVEATIAQYTDRFTQMMRARLGPSFDHLVENGLIPKPPAPAR